MKPAVCFLCGNLAVDEPSNKKGDWVQFGNFQQESSLALGHPSGLEYLCGEHLSAAKRLIHENSDAALSKLKEKYGRFDRKKKMEKNPSSQSILSRLSNILKR